MGGLIFRTASTYPRLLFAADPGALVSPDVAEDFARKLHNCRLVKLGSGLHYLQEDPSEAIGGAVAAFIPEVEGAPAKRGVCDPNVPRRGHDGRA